MKIIISEYGSIMIRGSYGPMLILDRGAIITNNHRVVRFFKMFRFLFIQSARVGDSVAFFRIALRP